MTSLPPTSDDRHIWDLWLSLHRLPMMTVADETGIFDALCAKAMTTDELAAKLGFDLRALSIHLGYLASISLLERHEQRWRATATTRTWLTSGGDGYWGPLLSGYRQSHPLHEQLKATLQARETGHASAVAEWERGELPQEFATHIAAFMNAHSIASSKAAARNPMFKDVGSVLDVGGGSGIFSIELAGAWPRLKAHVLDIGTMCKAAQAYIDASDVADRVSTVAIDMFREDWPGGHDALFFSNIFHDWSEATNRMLAEKAFAALRPGGRIILHEMLMDDDGCGPETTASFSLLMLLGTRGKQYSRPELRDILESAGFTDVDSELTGSGYYSLVTARKHG